MSLFTALATHALDNARRSLDDLREAIGDRRTAAPVDPGDSGDLTALSLDECAYLLGEGRVGRLAYVARSGTPDIVPVNYLWQDGIVLIRSGPGPKLQAAERGEIVAFEIDDVDHETQKGWSVVVIGKAEKVHVAELSESALPEPWANGPRPHVIRIQARRISGRRIV